MKKIVITALAAVMILGLGVGSVSAASASNSLKTGTFGFNVGFGDSVFGDTGVISITGKYLLTSDLALLAGIGTQVSSGDLDADYFATSVGVRKYLNTDDFAPFIEGKFSYAKEKFQIPSNQIDQTGFDFSANFGAEYFLHKQFSIEGAVGVGFGTATIRRTGLPDQDYTYFGTHSVGISANFYF